MKLVDTTKILRFASALSCALWVNLYNNTLFAQDFDSGWTPHESFRYRCLQQDRTTFGWVGAGIISRAELTHLPVLYRGNGNFVVDIENPAGSFRRYLAIGCSPAPMRFAVEFLPSDATPARPAHCAAAAAEMCAERHGSLNVLQSMELPIEMFAHEELTGYGGVHTQTLIRRCGEIVTSLMADRLTRGAYVNVECSGSAVVEDDAGFSGESEESNSFRYVPPPLFGHPSGMEEEKEEEWEGGFGEEEDDSDPTPNGTTPRNDDCAPSSTTYGEPDPSCPTSPG